MPDSGDVAPAASAEPSAPPPIEDSAATPWQKFAGALRPYARPLAIVGLHFLVFSLARLVLLVSHRSDFASLSVGSAAWAFVRGLRFDASIIFTIIALPVFALLIPFRWAQSRWWQGVWGWLCYATLVGFLFVLSADTGYFGYVHRHIGPEVTVLEENADQTALVAVREYAWAILAFVGVVAGLFWLWRRMMRWPACPPANGAAGIAVCLIAIFPIWVAARGTPVGKRLKVIDAFVGVTPSAAYLALNGPFAIFHSIDDRRALKVNFYPEADAVAAAQRVLFAPGEKPVDPRCPLLREHPAQERGKPNVVLIMMESWEAYYIDVLRREMGLPPLGCTPDFDRLSGEGVLFTRFYATGQKSIEGLCALLAGFPALPRTPYLGRGMEQSRLTLLGGLASREGYDTYFVQTEKRNSFRADVIADLAGFRSFAGSEDIPHDPSLAEYAICDTAWDEEMYAEANRRFAAARRPFLGFLYTGATHAPCHWPGKKWERFPPDSMEHRYANSVAYSDWALGQFLAAAKAAGYFDRTIFIITADHVAGIGSRVDEMPTLHHIPCLIIGPGLQPRLDKHVGGQLDIVPTIIDLAGWGATHASIGRSLFDESAGENMGAFCVAGDMILRIERDGWVAHNLTSRVAGKKYAETADLDAAERRLLSVMQVATTLLVQNRLTRGD